MTDKEVIEKLENIIKEHKILPKHTNFQIEHFMIGKEFTTEGQIWQCIRELTSRSDSLKSISLELEDIDDNIELLKIKIQKLQIKPTFSRNKEFEILNKKQKEIMIKKMERRLQASFNTKKNIEERKEAVLKECEKIIEIFIKLNPENKLINIDDDKNQLAYWNSKFGEEVALSSMLGYSISPEVVQSILALPNTAPVKAQMILAMESQGKKMLNSNN